MCMAHSHHSRSTDHSEGEASSPFPHICRIPSPRGEGGEERGQPGWGLHLDSQGQEKSDRGGWEGTSSLSGSVAQGAGCDPGLPWG